MTAPAITTKHATLRHVAEDIAITTVGLQASYEPSRTSTDRKAGRLRIPGKGRKGARLVVHDLHTRELGLLDHDTSQGYRTVSEATWWLAEWKRANPSRVLPFGYLTRDDVKRAQERSRRVFPARETELQALAAYTHHAVTVGAWKKSTCSEK